MYFSPKLSRALFFFPGHFFHNCHGQQKNVARKKHCVSVGVNELGGMKVSFDTQLSTDFITLRLVRSTSISVSSRVKEELPGYTTNFG